MKYKISAYFDSDLNEIRYSLSTEDYRMDILDMPTGSELLDLILAANDGELDIDLDPNVAHILYKGN